MAHFLANLDINVLDLGVPVLSMHALFEPVGEGGRLQHVSRI